MWQWYWRCMCPIVTNGCYVFFVVADLASPIQQVQRPEDASPKTLNKNKIHRFAGR